MLTGQYKDFYDTIKLSIPKERLFHDALSTLAYGTDASFYRLVPKLVIRARDEAEVVKVLSLANEMGLPVTFRAAGTSLSGQAVSDSILLVAAHNWQKWKILDEGRRIRLQPGIRGAMANRYLLPYGRKIGPDPASIDTAMIGGIAANNASGMCCGTSQNSYKTVAEIRAVLADGSILDTAEPMSLIQFRRTHRELIRQMESISRKIRANQELAERIRRKYRIKNTTGYSLNAFIDYTDGVEIIKHLLIGSEGTLGFISEITYNTVVEHRHKALALAIYPDIERACRAVQLMKAHCTVSAAEIMDRAAIRSVENTDGVPEYLKSAGASACALLIETRASEADRLQAQVDRIKSTISGIATEFPLVFTTDPAEQSVLWKIRKNTLPTVAGMRRSGTTAIIEDVCFPIEELAGAVVQLRNVFSRNGYDDAIIFGHALEGNIHFMFNQDFGIPEEVERYRRFMDDIADLVVKGYDGSLKAEHGTGRNMAPFVEQEWGDVAYRMMLRIKQAFDPKGILNPGVIINDDPMAHLRNLKPMPSVSDAVDKCMECGFCEGSCVSDGLTLSPRQRVVAFREMERIRSLGDADALLAEMEQAFHYAGMDTCATDSLCLLKCPVGIDAGKLMKRLRSERTTEEGRRNAMWVSENMDRVTSFARGFLKTVNAVRLVLGKRLFGVLARGLRRLTGGRLPLWNEYMPTGARKIKLEKGCIIGDPDNDRKVVYFPSCITRTMGTTPAYSSNLELTRITEKLLLKAGFTIIYPENLEKLCCGMSFSSKGFVEAGKRSSDELKAALLKASQGGRIPVLCDMSPCLYTMRTNMEGALNLYEPAQFLDSFVMDRLRLRKLNRRIAVFPVCTAKKLGVDGTLQRIAERCAKEVVTVGSDCCGFAGDRGFTYPELNRHGLRNLKGQLDGCKVGYSTSRTCEIGQSNHSGIVFKSIIYLVAESAGISIRKKPKKKPVKR